MSMLMAGDLAPLRRRLGALFVLRLVLAATVLAATSAMPKVLGVSLQRIAPMVAIYLITATGVEAYRQLRAGLPTALMGATLLADGIFMTGVLTVAGGPGTPMAFLLYVQLIAVTLLASYRTGLKIALWQSLLLMVAHYLPKSVTGIAPPSRAEAVFGVVTFLGVALVTAVCSSLTERELRRSRAGFRALADMAAQMEDVQNPDEVVAVLLRAVPRYFGRCRATLFLRDESSISFVDGDRITTRALDPGVAPDQVVKRCWDERGPVLVRSLDAHANPTLSAVLPRARNLVVLPFTADAEAVGALVVERGGRAGLGIGASVVAMLGQFATHGALAHRNVRLLAEVKHLATVDALTGLSNRRTFEDALQREIARSTRTGAPMSLLLVDVDHFKLVNDHHGHPMGDEVLRHVGRVLATHGREEDLPARYGGEEFAVILPGCPPEEALGVAERLRAGISGEDAPLRVTASVGAASLHRNAVDAEGLITAADTALYAAKASGRDRTVAATTAHLHAVDVA
jgi:diguanylate cyclase (GGDEF)-like protein